MDETEEYFSLLIDSDVSNIIVAITHNTRCNDQTGKKKTKNIGHKSSDESHLLHVAKVKNHLRQV